MEHFYTTALRWLKNGQKVACITVIETKGSTPRHMGAMMLVNEEGTIFETIGGGAVEHEVTVLAQSIASGADNAQIVERSLGPDLAMCCGGQMTFWIESLNPYQELLEKIVGNLQTRRTTLLLTDFENTEKSIVNQEAQDGERSVFVQRIESALRLTIFGCGHVGKKIGELAFRCGFDVVICDDNHTGELEHDLAWASKSVASFEWSDVFKSTENFSELDMVLIVTRDHEKDEELLRSAMGSIDEIGYLGLIGSKGKLGRFKKRLVKDGVTEGWDKLHCPIGLDIGAETPMEIAVSVLAELLQVKNKRRPANQ